MNSRQKLAELSRQQEEELESEFDELAEKGKKIATQALLIAGGLALTYMIFKAFDGPSGKPKKKKKTAIQLVKDNKPEEEESDPSWFSEISGSFAKEAAVFLLAMAKDRLVDYLNSRNEPAEGNTGKKKDIS